MFIGIPQLLYRVYGKSFLYQNKSCTYTGWFLMGNILTILYYKKYLINYFDNNYLLLCLGTVCIVLLYFFVKTKNVHDIESKSTYNLKFKVPKIFEISFQQITFLAGLLSFGISPLFYGILFFGIHIPLVFVLPKRFSYSFIGGSLFGGIIFAYLHTMGVFGFLLATLVHFLFYILLDMYLSKSN